MRSNGTIMSALARFVYAVVFQKATEFTILGSIFEKNLSFAGNATNQNREAVVIWPSIVSKLFMLTLLVTLGIRFSHAKAPSTRSRKWRKENLLRMEIILQILGIFALLIAVIFTGFFFTESKEIVHSLGVETDDKSALIKRLKDASDAIYDFISTGLSEGKKIANSVTMKRDEANLAVGFRNYSNGIIGAVYQRFQLTEMVAIQAEITRLSGIQLELLESSRSEISKKMNVVTTYASDLVNIQQKLVEVLVDRCGNTKKCATVIDSLKASTDELTLTAFQQDPIPNLINSLKDFRTQLKPWFQVVQEFDQSLSKIRSKLSSTPITFKVWSPKTAQAKWNQINAQSQFVLEKIQEFNQTLTRIMDKVLRTGATAIISAIGGIFSALLVITFVFLLGFIRIAMRERVFGKRRLSKVMRPGCSSTVVWSCGLLSIIIVITTVLIVCATFGSSFLFTEGCIYFKEGSNILDLTDFVFNGFFHEMWLKVDEETRMNLPPPKNIFKAILKECKRSNNGLVSLIGWKDFSATFKLIDGEHFQDIFLHWKNLIMPILRWLQKEISNGSEISRLRNSLSQTTAIHRSSLVIQDVFSPKRLNQARLELISQNLAVIKSTVSQIADIAEKFDQLYRAFPKTQSVMSDIMKTSKMFQSLDELALISSSFLIWLENLTKKLESPLGLEAIISDIVRENANFLNSPLAIKMHSAFDQLFSCSTLQQVISDLLEAFCGNRGFLEEIFAWGIIVWIENVIFFTILLPIIFGLHSINDSISNEPN